MKIDRALWTQAQKLHRECIQRGNRLTRKLIIENLEVSDSTARAIYSALESRDVIISEPQSIKSNTGDRELILADIHIPFQDDSAVEAALQFADDFKPNIICILGDLIDFYKISSFITNPQKKDITQEIVMTEKWLSSLRERYPDARMIYYEGNHEMRIDRYIMSQAPQLYELTRGLLQARLKLDSLNISYVTEPFRIGRLWHLHGHEKPGGAYNPEYVCNVMWQYVHDHFVVGHYHRTQEKHYGRIDGKKFYAGAIGHLAGMLDYARLNKWNQGFAAIQYTSSGDFQPSMYSVVNGVIY